MAGFASVATTWWPRVASVAAVGSPTWPVPTTPTSMLRPIDHAPVAGARPAGPAHPGRASSHVPPAVSGEGARTVARMQTAVVTGGAGFIGSHLCERLLDEGWTVHAVDD